MIVLNMAGYEGVPSLSELESVVTTVPGLSKELLSVDEHFRYGRFNVLLRQPDFEDGVSELFKPAMDGKPAVRIPLVYDYCGKGGWHMYFVPSRGADLQDIQLLARHIEDEVRDKGANHAKAILDSLMSQSEADNMHAALSAHDAVLKTVVKGADDENSHVIIDPHLYADDKTGGIGN